MENLISINQTVVKVDQIPATIGSFHRLAKQGHADHKLGSIVVFNLTLKDVEIPLLQGGETLWIIYRDRD